MKQLVKLLVILALSLTLFSCDPFNTGGDGPGITPRMSTLLFTGTGSASTLTGTFITYTNVSPSLIVNGQNCEIVNNYTVLGVYTFLFDLPTIEPGSLIEYKLTAGDNIWEGNLNMPSYLEVAWPEFVYDEDFAIQWETAEDPGYFLVDYSATSTVDHRTETDEAELEGSARAYTISQSAWNIVDNLDRFNVAINAVNSVKHGDALNVMATIVKAYDTPVGE